MAIQNDQRSPASETHKFWSDSIISLKIFNINMPYKHVVVYDWKGKQICQVIW